MADPTKGGASVTLADGRKVTFVFDLNAWIDISDKMGMEVPDVLKALQDPNNPPNIQFQRIVMWGGLQKHHPELTVRDAGEILIEASEAMAKSMRGGMPQDGEGDDDVQSDPPKPRPGSGTKPRQRGRG